jgi:pimeloyl-ACP methyl ester carboxylesterase
VVSNAGHWLPLEAPYTINNLLLDFIPDAVKLPGAG